MRSSMKSLKIDSGPGSSQLARTNDAIGSKCAVRFQVCFYFQKGLRIQIRDHHHREEHLA